MIFLNDLNIFRGDLLFNGQDTVIQTNTNHSLTLGANSLPILKIDVNGDVKFEFAPATDSAEATALLMNPSGVIVKRELGPLAFDSTSYVPTSRQLTLQGTSNQVNVSGGTQDLAGNRTWVLSLPQDIHTGATPTFAGASLVGVSGERLVIQSAYELINFGYSADPNNFFLKLRTENPVGGTVLYNWTMQDSNNGLQNNFLTFRRGWVGINKTNPETPLHVGGDAIVDSSFYSNAVWSSVYGPRSSGASILFNNSAGTNVASIDNGGVLRTVVSTLAGVSDALIIRNPINAPGTGHGVAIILHSTTDINRGAKIASVSESNFAPDNSFVIYTSSSSTYNEAGRFTSLRNLLLGTSVDSGLDRLQVSGSGIFSAAVDSERRALTVTQIRTGEIAYFGASPVNLSNRNAFVVLQSPTIPQSGSDTTGASGILFRHTFGIGGVNGDANGGYIRSIREGPFTTTGTVATSLVLGVSLSNVDTEVVRITSGSNVGINTVPTQRLDVNGNIRVRSLATSDGDFVTTNADGVFSRRTASQVRTDLDLNTNYIQNQPASAQTGNYWISGNGRVDGEFRVGGTYRDVDGEALMGTSSGQTVFGSIGASVPRSLAFAAGNAIRVNITTGGNVLIGTNTWDTISTLQVRGVSAETNEEANVGFISTFLNSSTTIGTMSGLGLGSNNNPGAIITAKYVGATNAHDMYFATRNSSGTSSTRMALTSVGFLGVGTKTPIGRVTSIEGFTATGIANPTDTNVSSIQIGHDGTTGIIRTWNATALQVSSFLDQTYIVGGAERVRISNGLTSVTGLFQVRNSNIAQGGVEEVIGYFGDKNLWSNLDTQTIQIGFSRISSQYVSAQNWWDLIIKTGDSGSFNERVRITGGGVIVHDAPNGAGTETSGLFLNGSNQVVRRTLGSMAFANSSDFISNNVPAYSVLGKPTGTAGVVEYIAAGTNGVLRRSGTGNLEFGTLVTGNIGDNQVTLPKLEVLSGYRVLGNPSPGAQNVTGIHASADDTVLRRTAGGALEFGTLSNNHITSLAWSKLTGTPTTLAGYGIAALSIYQTTFSSTYTTNMASAGEYILPFDDPYVDPASLNDGGKLRVNSGQHWSFTCRVTVSRSGAALGSFTASIVLLDASDNIVDRVASAMNVVTSANITTVTCSVNTTIPSGAVRAAVYIDFINAESNRSVVSERHLTGFEAKLLV